VKEPGNLRFDVLQDPKVKTRFFIYEAYKDEAAVLAHKETPHYLACVEKLEDLMSEPRKKRTFVGLMPERFGWCALFPSTQRAGGMKFAGSLHFHHP
jgi:autoinducer 2-degrading protein